MLQERRERTSRASSKRNQARTDRWKNDRFAVPYRTDRPTISLGILWFVCVIGAIVYSPWLLAAGVAFVAGVAGLQTGHAWAKHVPSDRKAASALAALMAATGLGGTFGLGLGCVLLTLFAMALALATTPDPDSSRSASRAARVSQRDAKIDFAGVVVRSSIPVGLAAGSLVALTGRGIGAAIGLVLLVSAYETGDYLVGTGSANAVEGPVAGIAALAVVGAGLVLAKPLPFDGPRAILFSVLTAACCPLGQVLGSAVLPRGDAWAPGLRRLDSLLLAGPLWLLLL